MPLFATATAVTGALQLVSQVGSHMRTGQNAVKEINSHMQPLSLVDVARQARVEPILLIDSDVQLVPFLPDVVNSLHSNFTAYYLQAVEFLSTIGGVSVASKLAPLNPNRNITFLSQECSTMSLEEYKYSLPTPHNKPSLKCEAYGADVCVDKKATETLKENVNLSVGKMIRVELKEGKETSSMHIAIRLMAKDISSNDLVGFFTYRNHFDMNLRERWTGVQSGRLSFVKDFILCRDLIDASRNAQIKDKSGVLSQIQARANNNTALGLFSRSPSLATASNLAIVSTDTIAKAELQMGGKFSNFKVRQELFKNTQLMIIAVIDKGWERVTFYHHGMEEIIEVSALDLKQGGAKKEGSEIVDLMKAFMSGKPGI